jgi:DNA-binding response OmpR family regulator
VKRNTPPTILLVEDDEEVRESLPGLLERRGFRVLIATDEQESNKLLDDPQFAVDLILVNQRMASDEALAAGRRIRRHGKLDSAVPIVVLPDEFSKDNEGQDQSVGGNDYKSYINDEEQLDALLDRLLPR